MTPLGGFIHWSHTVRDPLIWLGEVDPVKAMDAAREEDPERMATRELLRRLQLAIGIDVPITARSLIERVERRKINSDTLLLPKFRALLIEQAGRGNEIDPIRLGKLMRRIVGRVHGGKRLDANRLRAGCSRFEGTGGEREV